MLDARQAIGRLPMQTLRPQDLEGFYANPRKSLADLERRGVVHKIAHGYYCLVPAGRKAQVWLPELESAAAAVATAIWGDGIPVLMGLSAARVHGALPRAHAAAVTATPSIHGAIRMTDRAATIRFATRDVDALDAVRVGTELGRTLVTTPAQTALDLARDPTLLDQSDLVAVTKALLTQTTLDEVSDVARTQGRTSAAFARVRKAAAL